MLKRLVELSLRFRSIVVAIALGVAAYGALLASEAKLDVFPEFTPPFAVIQTECPGLTAEQVEALVTRPVEDAAAGSLNVEIVRSDSIPGLSIVTAIFEEGTDLVRARTLLGERLAEIAARFPDGVRPPRLAPMTSATMDLLSVGLTSDRLTPMELRSFVDWQLRPHLRAVRGVASVNVFGGEVRQLQIQLLPDRMRALDLAIDEVVAAARRATGVRGAGFVESDAQRVVIETRGQALSAEQLGAVPLLSRGGRTIRVSDVARVADGAEPKFGDARIQGRPGVLLTMLSQLGANTMETTRAVEEALAELAPAFEANGITVFPRMHRPATFIQTAISNLEHSLLVGAALVAAVLCLFLANLRTAFISLTAIPLSLLVAVIVLESAGATLNTITLGGLAIALGEVVDDAIIDVENILRRLRQNRDLAEPRSAFAVVLDASLEVRSAVVYATILVGLVFVPVIALTGLQGRLFAPLGVAYILATLASLGVALTLTPALSLMLLPRALPAGEPRVPRLVKAAYAACLRRVAPLHGWVLAAVALACAAAIAVLPRLGGQFLPEFREGHFVLHVFEAPGTSLPELARVGERISAALLANPHVATVAQQIGRAELGEDPWGPHRSEFHVELKPSSADEQEQAEREIRATLAAFPGIHFDVMTFLGDRIAETLTGETAPVVVSVYGDDLDRLDAAAADVARVLASVPGAVDVQRVAVPSQPQMSVELRRDRLAQLGVRPVDALEAVETAYQGTVVAQSFEANRRVDVVVILAPEHRRDAERIGDLLLRASDGRAAPLRALADVRLEEGRFAVQHEGGRRRQSVTCNAEGRDVSTFVADAKREIGARVALPQGSYVVFRGAAEANAAARRQLFWNSAIAGAAILLLLAAVFRRARLLALVLANAPFALVGGVAAVLLTGATLSLGSLVGFVTLFGISMRNSIMMVSHFQHLVAVEGAPWTLETTLRGASERVVPILMTALVTGLALFPIALGSGEPGREIEGPMAVVILGGLVTSTALNLLVLPSLSLRFLKRETLLPTED